MSAPRLKTFPLIFPISIRKTVSFWLTVIRDLGSIPLFRALIVAAAGSFVASRFL